MENPFSKYINRQVTFRATVGTLILTVTGALGIGYLIWEVYWYNRVGLGFVRWHTHLFPYMALFWVTALVGKTRYKNKFLMSVAVFAGVFFLVEIVLMVSGSNKTSHEKKQGYYVSPYETYNTRDYHTWDATEPTHRLVGVGEEFTYERPTNRLGFSDEEWELPSRTPGQKRILALGDSFTEGDGAPFDSSYVAYLKRYLRADGDSSYVMNGGVCGSDPFENFRNLEHLLIDQKPDYIIQTVSSNDMYTDIAVKGGFERFGENGRKYKPGPWWEPVFAASYVSRLFFSRQSRNQVLVNENSPELNQQLNADLEMLFARYIPFCQERHITLMIVILPDVYEAENGATNFDFGPMKRLLDGKKDVYVCELMPYYTTRKKASPGGLAPYYWTIDRHHNGKGYGLMAEAIYGCLKPLLFETRTP